MEHTAYIGLGSNLGDCENNLRNALLDCRVGTARADAMKVSSFYQTDPMGPMDQPAFLNAVAQFKTSLSYRQLFEHLRQIEDSMGRQRTGTWAPRTIDLDLLLYDDVFIDEPDLKIPHPQMHLRSFVLKGLCELCPDKQHPLLDRTMKELYDRLNCADYYLDPQKPQLISITGNIGSGKTTLAAALAERLSAKLILEKYDDNPFLADVYAGKTELALDSELFFLSSGASQLRKDRMKPSRRYISDYVFDKALIYASYWLKGIDFESYQKHYQSVQDGVTNPVLVIYLTDTLENCLGRIHQRNRPYEQQIEPSFLEHLARGYDSLYTDHTVCPVLRLNPDQCRTPDQIDRIAQEVQYYII